MIRRIREYRKGRRAFFDSAKRGIVLYESFYLSSWAALGAWLVSLAAVCWFAWFFYRSAWAILPLSPLACVLYRKIERSRGHKRIRTLEEQFKETILSVSANLRAGYSIENAFRESLTDIESLYGEDSLMAAELHRIISGLSMGVPLAQLLDDFGDRSGSQYIMEFAEVFSIARNAGGSLPEVIASTAELIGSSIEQRAEIDVTVSGKRMEQNIMNLVPFGIVLFVGFTSPGFFDPLYHSLQGVVIMTACLGLYVAARLVAGRILNAIS